MQLQKTTLKAFLYGKNFSLFFWLILVRVWFTNWLCWWYAFLIWLVEVNPPYTMTDRGFLQHVSSSIMDQYELCLHYGYFLLTVRPVRINGLYKQVLLPAAPPMASMGQLQGSQQGATAYGCFAVSILMAEQGRRRCLPTAPCSCPTSCPSSLAIAKPLLLCLLIVIFSSSTSFTPATFMRWKYHGWENDKRKSVHEFEIWKFIVGAPIWVSVWVRNSK